MSYLGRSGLRQDHGGGRVLELTPNLTRDLVAFDAPLTDPLAFREAISALHELVFDEATVTPTGKRAYQVSQAGEVRHEQASDQRRRAAGRGESAQPGRVSAELQRDYRDARHRYWSSRRELNQWLQRENRLLWRQRMPYDPVMTVADDALLFECFSADESSYGCLTVDRQACFGVASNAQPGTTNVDYSWDLYNDFQALRTYRETRFHLNPAGFHGASSGHESLREEQVELPGSWLRGFMQLQAAMGLPMRRVPLSVSSVYSLFAFLKRHRAKHGPRALRFELADGKAPRMVLEPWEQPIESPGTTYQGPHVEPVRIWGRRRLLALARLLPLAGGVDVYLLGTGLPSFWVVRLGSMRLTLGLSGWTTNDGTRGSAAQMLMPPTAPADRVVTEIAAALGQCRVASLADLMRKTYTSALDTAAALNQLALRGQVMFDLHADGYRWRQALPQPLTNCELGPPHPELEAARQILRQRQLQIVSQDAAPRGGLVIVGKAEGRACEARVSGDGIVKKAKCGCGWHRRFGIRNGPCRHIQALRDFVWINDQVATGNWYRDRLRWAGKS